MGALRRAQRPAVLAAVCIAGLLAAGCGGSGGATNQSSKTHSISMVVSEYMFDSVSLTNKYAAQITKEWDAKYPNVKLNVIKIAGTDVDEADTLALRFKQPSTTPDVVATETPYLSQYAASGYLLPLDKNLASAANAPFWSTFAQNVKNMTAYNGHEYGVSAGNNDQALLYNKQILKASGVPVPWKPANWSQIISAAQKVKTHFKNVIPLWTGAGVQAGPFNVGQGIANLIYGTPTPTMYDPATRKWVVKSPGLTAALNFYHQVFSQGLGAPTSQLFTTQAIAAPLSLMQKGKLAITLASNWMPEAWATPGQTFTWKQAGQDVGIAPIPTETGQAPGITGEVSGWTWAVPKASSDPTMAWNLIKMNLEPKNQLDVALWSGFVPPSSTVANSAQNLAFDPPFQAAFNSYLKYGRPLPDNENFTVYARGVNEATGDIAQNPNTSVSSALSTISNAVQQQLGPGSTENKG